ncbi:uncharacterized protein [Battus philenor]|uniref:uncharacterized protein n=1 Tax=Battus philenor TaxID=42288 RepID=UPI0035CF2BCA
MDEEKLIKCVRKYEFLYNLQHPKYMDKARSDMAWREIAKQVNQPATACKQRWQRLRDAYRRALNKKKNKSGLAAKNIKKWKYEEEMSFVASFFVERKRDSVELTSDDEVLQNSDQINAAAEFHDQTSDNEINDDLGVSAVESQHEDETTFCSISSQAQSETKMRNKTKKAKIVPVHSASNVLMSRLLDQHNMSREHNELDRFFLNISETVKKFSPYQQALAKNKIFHLVSEMELQQLAPSQYSYVSPALVSSNVQEVSALPKLENE